MGSLSKSATERARQRAAAQDVFDPARGNQSAAERDAPAFETDFERSRGIIEVLLLGGLQRAVTHAADHGLPVDRAQEGFDLPGRHARRIAAAHERTDTRPGDAIDGDAQFFEHLEHAHVCATPRAPPASTSPIRGLFSAASSALLKSSKHARPNRIRMTPSHSWDSCAPAGSLRTHSTISV